MRRDPVRPPLEPARRDCRQTAALGLGRKACRRIFGAHAAHLRVQRLRCSLAHARCARCAARRFTRIWATWIAESLVESFSAEPWGSVAGLDRPAWVIIGRLVSFPGLRLHAQARAGWGAPQGGAIGVALWVVLFAAVRVSAD